MLSLGGNLGDFGSSGRVDVTTIKVTITDHDVTMTTSCEKK